MLYFKIKKYLLYQEILVLKHYKNLKFAILDIFQKLIYSLINPYRISKKFLMKNSSQDIHMYGETPIAVFNHLLKNSNLSEKDTFFELGCGRGRLCYFISLFYKCKVVAIEQIPTFARILKFLQVVFRIKNLKTINRDMFNIDYSSASFLYLYGTCLKEDEVLRLIEKFKSLKKGSKILTISVSLRDYDDSFQILEKQHVNLPWGRGEAFLQVKA